MVVGMPERSLLRLSAVILPCSLSVSSRNQSVVSNILGIEL